MEEQLSGREEPCYLQSKWTWLWATIGEMKSILPSLVLIVTALRPCSTFTTPTPQTERGSIFKFASYYNSRGDDYYDDEEYYPRRRGLNNYYDRQGTHPLILPSVVTSRRITVASAISHPLST